MTVLILDQEDIVDIEDEDVDAADQTDKSTATRMVCLLHPIPKHSKFEFFLRSESLLLNLITISYPKTMLTFDNWLE